MVLIVVCSCSLPSPRMWEKQPAVCSASTWSTSSPVRGNVRFPEAMILSSNGQ